MTQPYADYAGMPRPQPQPGERVTAIGGFSHRRKIRRPENFMEQMLADVQEIAEQMVKQTVDAMKMLGKTPLIRRINPQGYTEFIIPKEMGPRERYEYYQNVFADDEATLAWIQTHSVEWALEAMKDYQSLMARYES